MGLKLCRGFRMTGERNREVSTTTEASRARCGSASGSSPNSSARSYRAREANRASHKPRAHPGMDHRLPPLRQATSTCSPPTRPLPYGPWPSS